MVFQQYTWSNLAQWTFASNITAGTTTWILTAWQGWLFPTTFPFIIKAESLDVNNNVIKREIATCTNRIWDTLTVTRASEACPASYTAVTQTATAQTFSAGDTISLVITPSVITDIQTEVNNKLPTTGGIITGPLKQAQGTNIVSATTTNLANATWNYIHITWATTINSFWVVSAGAKYELVFDSVLTLTHNATSMILPTGSNITTQAGDVAIVISEGGGNWRIASYERKDGTPLWWSLSGEIKLWSTTTAPIGWLVCNGGAISRTTYASLFAVIGTIYGVWDGVTTFNIPNMQNRTPVGLWTWTFNALWNVWGAETHTLTPTEMPIHNHSVSLDAINGFAWWLATGINANTASTWYSNSGVVIATGVQWWDWPHNNLQPYIVINYIIKT